MKKVKSGIATLNVVSIIGPMERYDVIVVGTGAGGSGVATRCATAGWRVAVADDEPYGGTCMLRGCDPKKVLVSASELVDWHRRMT
ncbi:MAG TPA: FAD-dependent oxidoreductase, partial [Gemmatimonadaceae bacterium]|nr:FAD-dependent oxidoreductase [Gemmatimonadaceae bacterium]